MPAPTPSVRPQLLGRRSRTLAGPVTARAAGNSVVTSDLRGGGRPAAYPGADNGDETQSSTFMARDNGGLITPTTPDLRQPDQSRAAYGGGWSDGLLTIRERAVLTMRGTSRQGAQQSSSGVPNPQSDGIAQPQYLLDNRTLSWQTGTDKTTQEDNPGPFAATATTQIDAHAAAQNKSPAGFLNYLGGRAFPLGNQGDPYTPVWGGTPHMVRDYGVRGTAGITGAPAPKIFAVAGDGSGARPGTLLTDGDPADGPQKIRGGVPHGLHSPTLQAMLTTMARLGSIPLQKPPRDDRPNNSRIAGQSMSQTYPREGSTATGRIPRIVSPGRNAGITMRFLGRRT